MQESDKPKIVINTKHAFFRRGWWLLVLSFLFLLPNFIGYHLETLSKQKLQWETFEPRLAARLSSVREVLRFTDSLAASQNIQAGSLQYGVILNRVIKWRFHHGYSHYALNENWVAAAAGRLVWNDLSAIVLPEDILKYPMAACSQQSIVLMACLRRKGLSYRKIGFDHHYVVEANLGGNWYYFDPDMEPDFSNTPRGSLDFLKQNDLFPTIYKKSLDSLQIRIVLNQPYRGKINAQPAPNAAIFQTTTKIASKTLWLVPLLFYLFIFQRRKRSKMQSPSKTLLEHQVYESLEV